MRILVVGFYFPPDLSAGSFRTTSLVDALNALAPAGSQIDVVTTQPNRYHSFSVDAPRTEQRPGVTIHRIPLPKHRNGVIDQSKAFLAFFRGAVRLAAGHEYDVVVATSGRLMTAVLGAHLSRRTGAPLYLDIRDIFVDTITDLSLNRVSWIAKPVFSALERWAISRASVVNLVSRGFTPYFTRRYPDKRFTYYPNGIDDEFLEVGPDARAEPSSHGQSPLTVVYAGNFGEGQGLHVIIPELARRTEGRLRFKLIGDGSRRGQLETALSNAGVTNVELMAPVRRAELLAAYEEADVLFLQLNDFPALTTVLPSKLFEYAALGKPVWAGVAGYTAEFVRSEIDNAAVFHPCDVDDALRAFDTLRIQHTSRTRFRATYARPTISRRMAVDILALAKGAD